MALSSCARARCSASAGVGASLSSTGPIACVILLVVTMSVPGNTPRVQFKSALNVPLRLVPRTWGSYTG